MHLRKENRGKMLARCGRARHTAGEKTLDYIIREFAKLVNLNILYYMETKSAFGGVSNVAYYLTNALAKKVNMTYFPLFMPKKVI